VITVSPTTRLLLELGAALAGAALALLLFSLLVWTWRDVAARTRGAAARWGALLLVLAFNVLGLVIYLLLRPRETIAERREREMIEEILAREITALAMRGRPGRATEADPG
jgi:hypothetical protein